MSPPEEMNPASPLIRCFWLSVTRSMTTTLESSAESRGTSTRGEPHDVHLGELLARPARAARASYQSPGADGSWRTISRCGNRLVARDLDPAHPGAPAGVHLHVERRRGWPRCPPAPRAARTRTDSRGRGTSARCCRPAPDARPRRPGRHGPARCGRSAASSGRAPSGTVERPSSPVKSSVSTVERRPFGDHDRSRRTTSDFAWYARVDSRTSALGKPERW